MVENIFFRAVWVKTQVDIFTFWGFYDIIKSIRTLIENLNLTEGYFHEKDNLYNSFLLDDFNSFRM